MDIQVKQNPLPYSDLRAFHGDPAIKDEYVKRLKAHHKADRLIQGQGWKEDSDGVFRGCAVGCTLESYNHRAYIDELGIPPLLAGLEDGIFESLPPEEAPNFAMDFLKEIPVGADLSDRWFHWSHWMLVDSTWGIQNKVEEGSDTFKAIQDVADLCQRAMKGDIPSIAEWRAARADAARAAYFASADAADAVDATDVYVYVARVADNRQEWAQAARDKLLELLVNAPVPEAVAA